jgi:hypothetical protein
MEQKRGIRRADMFSAMVVGRTSAVSATSLIPPMAATRPGHDASSEDSRRRARQMRLRETRRILVDFREAARDRRRSEPLRRHAGQVQGA